jgi:prolyl-tRNA synthetase
MEIQPLGAQGAIVTQLLQYYYIYVFLINCLNWQGVPIRVEIGPRDLQSRQVITKSRDLVDKETVSMATAVDRIGQLMEEMHDRLFTK